MNESIQGFQVKPPIHTCNTEQVSRRQTRDRLFLAIPIILIILQIAALAFSFFLMVRNETINKFPLKSLFVIFFFLLSIMFLLLYSWFLVFFRNYLIKIVLAVCLLITILPAVLTAIIIRNVLHIVPCIVPLCVGGIFLYCIRAQIKLASLTGSRFLSLLRHFRMRYTFAFLGPIMLVSLIFFLAGLLITNIGILMAYNTDRGKDNFYVKSLSFSVLLVFIVVVYFIKLLYATAFTYGAATYNQYSLSIEKSEGADLRPSSSSYLRDAYTIAYSKSFGSSCLAAFLLFLIDMVKLLVDDGEDANKSILHLIFSVIINLLGDLFECLTASALLYTAIYGKPIIKSGKMALESFKSNGLKSLLNVYLIGTILSVLSLVFFFVCLLFGNLILFFTYIKPQTLDAETTSLLIFLLNSGFISGWLYINTFNAFVTGGANVQIAIYIEDPQRFERQYKKLNKLKKYLGMFQ